MAIHKEQRVGIFVDVQNMYYSAKQLYNAKVNFNAILKEGVAGRKLIRAMAYVISADIGEEKHFFDALSNIGFDIRVKNLQIFFGGAKKGDWDVGLAMDVIRMAGKLDTIVLVSGDGDFKDMLEYVKAVGCRAEVIAFGKTTSSRLKEETDLFIDMDKQLRKFLIRTPLKRQVRKSVSQTKPTGPAKKSRQTSVAKSARVSKPTAAAKTDSAKTEPTKKAPVISKNPIVKIEMPK